MTTRIFPALILLAFSACTTTNESVRVAHDGPWIQPSVDFERQIEQHAARLPYLQKLEDFVAEIQWFVGAGEPAYEALLELAASEDTKVAGTALAAMGGTGDARLVPHLDQIPWPSEDAQRLRYERARCHMKLGDWRYVSVLIEGLSDEDLYARSLCFKALKDGTGESFEYHPQLEAGVREASVQRWADWAERRELDSMNE